MKYWGVFGQFLPSTKYDRELLSVWTDKDKAIKAAKEAIEDLSWVQNIVVDRESMHLVDELEVINVKGFDS